MSQNWPRLPNVEYSWRMPVKAAAWKLAWWLMRRVMLGWMTPEGQAREIARALGAYRPAMQPGYLVQQQTEEEATANPSERAQRILPADYESFWERRYNEQHRTLHSCEDALKEARVRAERAEKERDNWKGVYENYRDDAEESIALAEAAARDFARTLAEIRDGESIIFEGEGRNRAGVFRHREFASDALDRHPSFLGEEETET